MNSKLFSFKSITLFCVAMLFVAAGVAQNKSTTTKEEEKTPDVTIKLLNTSPSQCNPDGTPAQAAKISVLENSDAVKKEIEINNADDPFLTVSEMPVYNDKENPLYVQVMKNARYPAELLKDKVEGIVIVQIIVEKDGSFTNPKVISSVHPKLDKVALDAVSKLDNTFTPGKHKGEEVRCYFQIPVPFLLPKPQEKK